MLGGLATTRPTFKFGLLTGSALLGCALFGRNPSTAETFYPAFCRRLDFGDVGRALLAAVLCRPVSRVAAVDSAARAEASGIGRLAETVAGVCCQIEHAPDKPPNLGG